MSSTPFPPDSQISQSVPKGLATIVGQVVAAVFGLIALAGAVLKGDHSEQTVTALILAAVTVWTLMAGRYAQAYALLKGAISPDQINDHSGEGDDPNAGAVVPVDQGPSDADLGKEYPNGPEPVDTPVVPPGLDPAFAVVVPEDKVTT